MRAGPLARALLTLQEITEGTTSYGAAELEWAGVGTQTFRAGIVQISGTPAAISGGLQEEAEYEITMRYDPALIVRRRLYRSETGQIFEIIRISNVGEKKHEVVLTCREIV